MLPLPSEFRKLREAGKQRRAAAEGANNGRSPPETRGVLKKKSSFNDGLIKRRPKSNNDLRFGANDNGGDNDGQIEMKRTRSVEFNSRVRVQEVETLVDVGGNVNDLWLQRDELKQLRVNRRIDAKQYKEIIRSRSKSPVRGLKEDVSIPPAAILKADNDDISYRGLEKYVDDKVIIRRANSREAVLDTQYKIKNVLGEGGGTSSGCSKKNVEFITSQSKMDDEKFIANLYKQTATIANMTAQQLGALDAMDVEDYLMTPRTKKLLVKSNPTTPTVNLDGNINLDDVDMNGDASAADNNPLMTQLASAPIL